MSDSIKHTMLENVVNGISDLRAVKTQVAQFIAQIGIKLTYEQYCTLGLSTAQAYDVQHAKKKTHVVQDVVRTIVQYVINMQGMIFVKVIT